MKLRLYHIVWVICILLAAAFFLLAPSVPRNGTDSAPMPIAGADTFGGEFTLTDHNGATVTNASWPKQYRILYFGFTFCPDVCPLGMTKIANALDQLPQDVQDKIQPLFITVDPERDTQALLKEYMANFDPSFIALRPEPDELKDVAAGFKIYYKKVSGSTPTSYTMDHSAGKYIFDTEARVRLFSAYGTDAATIASDIQILLSAA